MSNTNQWCVPVAGQDEFNIDFDRSLSGVDAEAQNASNNNINSVAFVVPDINTREEESKNNLEDCDVLPMESHGKKNRCSPIADIDCSNRIKRFCCDKDVELKDSHENRCHINDLSTSDIPTNTGHYYASGSMINPALSQVVQLSPALHSDAIEKHNPFRDYSLFQYVLMAPTSSAVKLQEENLTYLNQGQPYEIKVCVDGGNSSTLLNNIYKSVIHMGFQERRLQYLEKEQIMEWQLQRPGERIIEIDVPQTYGVLEVANCPQNINKCEFLWEPSKDIGVFLKVNSISTEFTPKKHGGEKGVPFRILIETYFLGKAAEQIHAASCQVKVFKPKGADRKHKTEREKMHRRAQVDKEKYHPQCEFTYFKNCAFVDPFSMNPSGSDTGCFPSNSRSSKSNLHIAQTVASELPQESYSEDLPYFEDPALVIGDVKCTADPISNNILTLTSSSSNQQAVEWLRQHMFHPFVRDFAHFSGADLISLRRRELIEICGLASGIRLYNCLHPKFSSPCLIIYVRPAQQQAFQAIYFKNYHVSELQQKLKVICSLPDDIYCDVFMNGPSGIHIVVTDEVIQNMSDESMFEIDLFEGSCNELCILLREINS